MEPAAASDQMQSSSLEPSAKPSAPRLPLTAMYATLLFVAGVILGVGGLLGYQEYTTSPEVTTYEVCINARGSRIQESYPATCITRDGKQFIQPLTEEERKKLDPPESTLPMETFTCPETEWVDCMPGPNQGIKIECTDEFLTWAKDTCPGFQGAAF